MGEEEQMSEAIATIARITVARGMTLSNVLVALPIPRAGAIDPRPVGHVPIRCVLAIGDDLARHLDEAIGRLAGEGKIGPEKQVPGFPRPWPGANQS